MKKKFGSSDLFIYQIEQAFDSISTNHSKTYFHQLSLFEKDFADALGMQMFLARMKSFQALQLCKKKLEEGTHPLFLYQCAVRALGTKEAQRLHPLFQFRTFDEFIAVLCKLEEMMY